ncbi:hypothetical protein FISHEDRAFT_76048 [Fistulina hepatica ATCC 64428]|uniref:RRM domain-containing protein n=1 Tax=Fistulina hepatica ATCC 64428 TaxID=1128425 RepID=A0A0D7A5A1_9AGAR|nr:hypothetical protein FISHEDRAFT_76048 [Fistulina hepatica ATCC 64428]
MALAPAEPNNVDPTIPPRPATDDPRVYFNRESNTWRLEDDEGAEMEYDNAKGAWVPVVDEDLLKRQQAAYSVAGVDEAIPAAPVLTRESKKRKQPVNYTSASSAAAVGPSAAKRSRDEHAPKEQQPTERKSKNTAVYVTGLPRDTELDELVQRFSKCGVIEEDEAGEPKVKMYACEDGTFSGEALVVYFREDSVTLALNILDEAELRMGDASTVMSVRKADFSHKNSGGGNSAQSKPRKTVDKKAISRRIGKMQKKLQEWVDEDGFGPAIEPEEKTSAYNQNNARVVVLKHMFTLKDLQEDASLILDLKKEVREECSTLGDVTNVVLYDQEPDGIMTVKFRDPLSARACILKVNGRFFDGRRVEASLFTGKQRFKRSGAGGNNTGEDEKQRLDDFAEWLLNEGE